MSFIEEIQDHSPEFSKQMLYMTNKGYHIMAINETSTAETGEFAMPAEFDNDAVATPPVANTYQSSGSQRGSLSDDELDNLGFDDQRDERERAKLDPPAGDWEKDDLWKCDTQCQVGNCQPGDLDPAGRTSYNIFGQPKPRQENGVEHKPTLFVRFSPDIRYKEDKPATTDMAYKLFLKAKDLFMALHGRKATSLRELKTMMIEDVYLVRTMKGDNGPFVIDIKQKRAPGQRYNNNR